MSDRIQITKPFLGKWREYEAGTYAVPGDISLKEAKCAIIDGFGKWAAPEPRRTRSTRTGTRKTAAPENKLRSDAPSHSEPGLA